MQSGNAVLARRGGFARDRAPATVLAELCRSGDVVRRALLGAHGETVRALGDRCAHTLADEPECDLVGHTGVGNIEVDGR